jgi:hypothetical protein
MKSDMRRPRHEELKLAFGPDSWLIVERELKGEWEVL